MADSAWSIRFFQANNYKDSGTIDFVSNFKKGKSRQSDTIITYSGMYGIDNYLIWNIHKDLPNYDFSTVALNLNLCLYKNPDIVYFQDFYRVQDIKYNPNKSQYTLFAISETSVKLHLKLIDYGVTSLSYKENRKASDIIREVIEGNDIFYVVYHEDEGGTKDMIDYEYRYFDIDPEWTVLEFIEYICNDNMYEWCIDKKIDEDNIPTEILHFGHELKAMSYRNATKDFEIERDNISHSIYSMKITTDGSPMEPLAHWKEEFRCIWSIHTAGRTGGNSKGCFVPIGMGHFDKYLYLRTLEGNIEKNIGYAMLTNPPHRKNRISSVGIGNILKDEGSSQFIDVVSIQKNPDRYPIREPHNILIDRGDDIAVQHQLEKITRSTPYLDHEAGLFFPSPKLDNPPPNSLIFNIDGRRESAVAGSFIIGDGRVDKEGNQTLKIPVKSKDDFRLRFPDGAELFYNKIEGFWSLNAPHGIILKDNTTDYDYTPDSRRVEGDEDSSIFIFKDNNLVIEGPVSLLMLKEGGCFDVVPKTQPNGEGSGTYAFECNNDFGRINLYANNKINIKADKVNGEIDIEISDSEGLLLGTININTKGTVNIGANASAVNIAGGGSGDELAYKNHNHIGAPAMDGLFKIPLIGNVASNMQGTTKTKAK